LLRREAAVAEHGVGWFHAFAAIDAPASSSSTRALLDWRPRECTLLEDIDSERYFPL